MARFTKRGEGQWQVKIRREGWPAKSATFKTRKLAEDWSHRIESEMAARRFVARRPSQHTTLRPRGQLRNSVGSRIDSPLVVGWDISGFCPGPALTALPLLALGILVFPPMVLIGLWLVTHGENLRVLTTKGAW